MENKEQYFNALIKNKGHLNEIDLGERMGFDENETREIITQLLSEYKIKYTPYMICNYSPMKRKRN